MTTSVQTADEAIAFLYSRIDYERISASLSASDFKLERMRTLLSHLGDPHEVTPVVHIAGTKGKGSTGAMIAAALTASGYRTGLFTSPHLERFEERIRIDAEPIPESPFVELVNELIDATRAIDALPGGMGPTFFELTTALAWLWFAKSHADIAVLEVGLGGRLDSTNLCRPELTVITTISRDHTHILGSRLSEIAAEKAGIIKHGIPVVSGVKANEARPVIREFAECHAAPFSEIDRDFSYEITTTDSGDVSRIHSSDGDFKFSTGTRGTHQTHNAAVATEALCQLRRRNWSIDNATIQTSIANVRCPARIEIVNANPTLVIDAAHNWASVAALLQTIETLGVPGRRVLIFAASRDKDVRGLLRRLVTQFDTVILTQFQSSPRTVTIDELQPMVAEVTTRSVHTRPSAETALQLAQELCPDDGLICIAGSFYLAVEMRRLVGVTTD
jgi:dihydrofolate synthase / folylpolyglutamate synthase